MKSNYLANPFRLKFLTKLHDQKTQALKENKIKDFFREVFSVECKALVREKVVCVLEKSPQQKFYYKVMFPATIQNFILQGIAEQINREKVGAMSFYPLMPDSKEEPYIRLDGKEEEILNLLDQFQAKQLTLKVKSL